MMLELNVGKPLGICLDKCRMVWFLDILIVNIYQFSNVTSKCT